MLKYGIQIIGPIIAEEGIRRGVTMFNGSKDNLDKKLKQLNKMVKKERISKEEYERLRRKLIETNDVNSI